MQEAIASLRTSLILIESKLETPILMLHNYVIKVGDHYIRNDNGKPVLTGILRASCWTEERAIEIASQIHMADGSVGTVMRYREALKDSKEQIEKLLSTLTGDPDVQPAINRNHD